MTYKNSKPGFSLLEIILYTALASFILVALTLFLGSILEARIKNQTIAEVEQQGIQIMQQITQDIRNAGIINSPSQGISSSFLSIDGTVPANNPAVFDLADNAVTVREGFGQTIRMTSQRIIASNLTFQNLSRTGTPGIIRISFTLSNVNPNGRNEYEYTKTFSTSVSLR